MAPQSSTLAWKIPWTEEAGRLQSMGSLRVGHDGATSLSLFTFMPQRRKWQPTPVFLPGESQGRQSLVGCRLWGRTQSDTTEATQQQQQQQQQIKHASWGTKRKHVCSHFYVILRGDSIEEGCLQRELISVLEGRKLSIKHEVLVHF